MIGASYLTDASGMVGWADRLIVPGTEAEVVESLRKAMLTKSQITIAGAGSGLTGARVPKGGWIMSLERFNNIEIEPGIARVGSAVTLKALRDSAAKTMQFYPPDPTEIVASIGGTIATNASGSRSFRFGSTRTHLQGVRVALMDGSVRWYRRGEPINFQVEAVPLPDTTKNTAGYRLAPGMDWVDLFCGSEGTLGVLLEAEVALLPMPAELFAGVIFFSRDEDALDAVDHWRTIPGLRMLEYADYGSLKMLRARYPEIPAEASTVLLIESEEANLDEWDARLIRDHALVDASWFAVNAKDREQFRIFRHAIPELVIETRNLRGFLSVGTDYAVPLRHNREMLHYYRRRLEEMLPDRYVIFGHIGDAHLHVNMLPASESEGKIAASLFREFAMCAVEFGGTVSAEHGLGKNKASLLRLQLSDESIESMRKVKQRLDPYELLGRGNLFDCDHSDMLVREQGRRQ